MASGTEFLHRHNNRHIRIDNGFRTCPNISAKTKYFICFRDVKLTYQKHLWSYHYDLANLVDLSQSELHNVSTFLELSIIRIFLRPIQSSCSKWLSSYYMEYFLM